MGTEANPIAFDVAAKITITDDGPIDQSWDPVLISRGVLLRGKTIMNGTEKSGFEAVSTYPVAGHTSWTLKQGPCDWQIGDEIVVASTHPTDPTQYDRVTITKIDGAMIRLTAPSAMIMPRRAQTLRCMWPT